MKTYYFKLISVGDVCRGFPRGNHSLPFNRKTDYFQLVNKSILLSIGFNHWMIEQYLIRVLICMSFYLGHVTQVHEANLLHQQNLSIGYYNNVGLTRDFCFSMVKFKLALSSPSTALTTAGKMLIKILYNRLQVKGLSQGKARKPLVMRCTST